MPRPFLIIDGYNLMHAAGMARLNYGPGELEHRRREFLVDLCVRLSRGERERTTVVFDAADAPPGLDHRDAMEGMEILFAPRGGDADTLIEELIAEHSAPRQILLVSSDHRLQRAARRRRAKFIDSEQFAARLERRGEDGGSPSQPRPSELQTKKRSGRLSRREVAEWLDLFGDIPEASRLGRTTDRLQKEVDELLEEADD